MTNTEPNNQRVFPKFLLEKENENTMFNTDIHLKFVNRKKEIVQIISKFVENYYHQLNSPDAWRKIYLLFSDQMHGFGKTTLGGNLISHAKFYKEDIFKNLKRSIQNEDFIKTTIDRICKMNTIQKNFSSFFWKEDSVRADQIFKHFFKDTNKFELAMSGILDDEMKGFDYFLHIDEVTNYDMSEKFVSRIRSLWSLLISIKYEFGKQGVILDFYLTGRTTLLQRVLYFD
jgi:hypothetical protein